MSEIRLLNVCRTLQGAPVASDYDAFDTIGANWSDAGTWTLDGVATSGLILSSGTGLAITGAINTLRTGRFVNRAISTTVLREVTLGHILVSTGAPGFGSEVSILMDMNATTPVPAASVRFRVARETSGPNIVDFCYLYINENSVVSLSVNLMAGHTDIPVMRMTIDSTNTIRCYWGITNLPVITHRPGGYIAAGGRVGFGIQASGTVQTSVDSFTFNYTLAAVVGVTNADLPPRTLVASASGKLYVELKNGTMAAITSPVRTLASDRLLSSVNRLEKLYIADYALRKHGIGTGSNTGTSFDDSGVADWTTLGIDADDDRLEILSGTTAPIGIYNITGIVAGNLTLSPTPPRNGSSLTYRIVRAPKVFDSAAMTLTLVPIGNVPDVNGLAVSPGQYPLGCTIVSAWDDRLLWSGDPLFPHVVYMSKQGDPDNYLYANETEGEAFAYDPARVSGASQIGDAVTAILPHSHDYCIFAGFRSFSIQRGDPTLGGSLDLISRDIGIVDKHAWCYTPEQVILGLSHDGLYLFQPSPDVAPVRVSRERLPAELLDINTGLYDVQMAYSIEHQGVHICLTQKIGGGTTHWWFDWGKKAFWPESYQSGHEPTAMCVHTVAGSNVPTVIFGGRDGYIRRAVKSAALDDGYLIPSTALLGPFMLGSPQMIGMLHRLWLELDNRSGSVTVDVLMGDTAEKARNALPAYSYTLAQAGDSIGPNTEIVRARGGACFIRPTNTTSLAWAMQSGALEREIVGERRNA